MIFKRRVVLRNVVQRNVVLRSVVLVVIAALFVVSAPSAEGMWQGTATNGVVYIDGEDASVRQSDGYIIDEGRTLRWQNQGDGQNLPVIDSSTARAGANSVAMQIDGASTGSTSQRSEYCLNACFRTSEPAIAPGDTWYTGVSFQLDSAIWAEPTSWFSIQQTQQKKSPGQVNNNPFISVEIKSGNVLDMRVGSGKDGDSELRFIHKEAITLDQGVWYDMIVGFEYSPFTNDGFLAVWIKTADEAEYTRYGLDNVKVGYTDAPQQVSQNKTGMYRARVPDANKMYFDEIRFATNLEDAKVPTPVPVLNGDVNCDLRLTVADAVAIAQHTVGLRTPVASCPMDPATDIMLSAADMNNNGNVTVADAVIVAQCITGIDNGFCPA